MLDVDPVTEKGLERKRHPRAVTVLKESIGATKITKCILGFRVSLTLGELLASAPVVENSLQKPFPKTRLCSLGSITLILTILFIPKILGILWALLRSRSW